MMQARTCSKRTIIKIKKYEINNKENVNRNKKLNILQK